MSAIIKHEDESIGIAKLGEIFFRSGYFKDVRDQSQAIVKMLYGRELGFSPVVSMMGIHIIEGKPSLSSNLLATLVKRSGKYEYRVVESTEKRCDIRFLQRDGNKFEIVGNSEFTIEDAKLAGVTAKPSWTRYPKAMLFARALSAGVKLYCPDVSACPLYVPEELGATVNEDGDVTELPKSARPIAVSEEEVVISKPLEVKKPNNRSETAPTKPPVEVLKEVLIETQSEFIDVGRQKNLHKEFRKAVRKDFPPGDIDFAFYDWLLTEGFYENEKGTKVPTTSKIPLAIFEAIKARALEKARSL